MKTHSAAKGNNMIAMHAPFPSMMKASNMSLAFLFRLCFIISGVSRPAHVGHLSMTRQIYRFSNSFLKLISSFHSSPEDVSATVERALPKMKLCQRRLFVRAVVPTSGRALSFPHRCNVLRRRMFFPQ